MTAIFVALTLHIKVVYGV